MKNYIKSTIDFYDKNVDAYIDRTIGLYSDEWIEKFGSLLPKNGKILDIGCAFGRDVKIFDEKGFDTTGIDLSTKMIEKAKSLHPSGKFEVMDMLDLKFEEQSFDGVWCSAAFLHVRKDDAIVALEEMHRVLKDGGYLYFVLKEGTGEKTVDDERYNNAEKFFAFYTKDEIQKLLSDNKFSIQDIKLSTNKEGRAHLNKHYITLIAQKLKK